MSSEAPARSARWAAPPRLAGPLAIVGAAIAGLVVAVWGLGSDVVTGQSSSIATVGGDRSLPLIGLRYFLDEPWGWPLLEIDGLNAPDGVSIGLMDSIPILAIPAKLVAFLGIDPETWLSLWLVLSFVGTAAAAAWAVRAWNVDSVVVPVAVGIVAVCLPFFALRFFHPSLTAHWILWLGWGLAGRLRHDDGKAERWIVPLALAGFLTHPYLFAMSTFVVGAALLDRLRRGATTVRRVAVIGASGAAGLAAILVAGGYLGLSGEGVSNYGDFPTSVTGPFVPQVSTLWPGARTGRFDADGSFEGFSYLGIGPLLVVATAIVALVTRRRELARLVRSHQVLAAGVVLLLLYAMFPQLKLIDGAETYHGADRFDYWLPGGARAAAVVASLIAVVVAGVFTLAARRWRSHSGFFALLAVAAGIIGIAGLIAPSTLVAFGTQFRANGRFWWPVGIGVTLAATVIVTQRWPRFAMGLVVVAAVLAVVETRGLRESSRALYVAPTERVAEVEFFTAITSSHRDVTMPVDFVCGWFPDGVEAFQTVLLAASADVRQVDNVYAARFADDASDCPTQVSIDGVDGDTVGFYLRPAAVTSDTRFVGDVCRAYGEIMVICSERWDQLPEGVVDQLTPAFE